MNRHFPHTVLAKRFAFLFSFPHALALQRVRGKNRKWNLSSGKSPSQNENNLAGKYPWYKRPVESRVAWQLTCCQQSTSVKQKDFSVQELGFTSSQMYSLCQAEGRGRFNGGFKQSHKRPVSMIKAVYIHVFERASSVCYFFYSTQYSTLDIAALGESVCANIVWSFFFFYICSHWP